MSKILNLKEYVIARTFSPWQSHEIASHSFAMTEQRGRSMVEMLGVLAIIGVLSVAGIAGYTNAMRSYRTNEIVNAISTLYVMGMAQNQGNGDKELLYSTIDTKLPSGVSALKYNGDKSISIAITDEDDYKMVKNKLGDKASEDTSGSDYSLKVSFGEATASSTPEPSSSSTPDNSQDCVHAGKYWLGPNKSENDLYDQFGCYDSEGDVYGKCQEILGYGWSACVDHICECQNE